MAFLLAKNKAYCVTLNNGACTMKV